MLTQAQLDELKMRNRKGWVIRPDQIDALIGMAEAHLYQAAKPADPNVNQPASACAQPAHGGYPYP